jgi:hypothetical protein
MSYEVDASIRVYGVGVLDEFFLDHPYCMRITYTTGLLKVVIVVDPLLAAVIVSSDT